MADILSQDEIDALLSTVSDDPTGSGSGGDESEDFDEYAPDFVPKKISVYDFRRPDRVSKEQLRSIRNLHDKFARNFSSNLSSFSLVGVDQMTYGEFLMSLPDPTSFNIISMIPLQGNAVLEINPSLIFPIVDKLLGGQGLPLFHVRELTPLEMTIIDSIITLILKDLEDVWKQIIPNVRLKKELSENSPHVIQIVAQNEVVVLVVFEVKFGEATGMMNICLPALILEPILNKISSQDWLIGAKKGRSGEYESRILELLENINVPLIVELGRTKLKIGEILNLRENDTVILSKKAKRPLNIYISNKHKFFGALGILGIKKAIKITRATTEQDDDRNG